MLPFLFLLTTIIAAPVSVTRPVTASQLTTVTGSTYQVGLLMSDGIFFETADGYVLQYPLFTAVLSGDTLTRDLLGSDHELAIKLLGYHDQTPYKLIVRLQTCIFDADGFLRRPPTLGSYMSKEAFDQYEAAIPVHRRRQFSLAHRPMVIGYPYRP